MARYASFCLIIGPLKGVPVFARFWPVMVKVRVSFTTGAVRSAILATAGLLVLLVVRFSSDGVVICYVLPVSCALITRQRFHLYLWSVWNTNRKSYLGNKMQPLAV